MKKALVVTAGPQRFCLDKLYVESIHSDQEEIESMLTGLNPDDSIIAEISTGSASVNLSELISTEEQPPAAENELIVLNDDQMRFGLFVDSASVILDVAEEAVQQMPMALSALCRRCFPEVVVLEKEVIPVITPASVMKLVAKNSGTDQAG